jgi:hypothetical protein
VANRRERFKCAGSIFPSFIGFRMTSKIKSFFIRLFISVENPLFAFIFAFLVYFLLSAKAGDPLRVRDTAYFNYLADAFLHGQLHLRLIPKSTHDLSFFRGHYYLYWPPMPAVVLMPFIAMFGVGFSDVFFNVVLASLNVALLAVLFRAVDRAGLIRIAAGYRAMLLFFFTLGTVHLILAVFGKVWFTAELVGFLFVELAFLAAIELKGTLSFFITGMLIACATLTRNPLLFTGIWPAYHLLARNWKDRPKLYLYMVAGLFPMLVMGLLFLDYNFLRFHNPFEVGLHYHLMDPIFVGGYHKYGAFNVHYVPTNFYYQYIYYPFPFTAKTLMGGSLFLLSPVFLYAFVGMIREYRNPNIWFWTLSILVTNIPILLLMGTGWKQFGPRYTLDFTIPLLFLTASGVQKTSRPLLGCLIVISVLQYVLGFFLYARFEL